jgi:hypothetical protein
MKAIVLAVLLAVVPAVAGFFQSASDAHEGITKAALDYAEGWYAGDAERMERAVHPDLAKRILGVDPASGRPRVDNMSAMTLVQFTRRGGGKNTPTDKRVSKVSVLDVYGNAASARLDMHDWIDYLHLSKIDDRWVIVNVLWELTDEAKQRRAVRSGD